MYKNKNPIIKLNYKLLYYSIGHQSVRGTDSTYTSDSRILGNLNLFNLYTSLVRLI
jgi:hypothetical protein